ncbi:MAG: ferredoxin [Proteobacteria bacterium]|nr:ferredoxin [Pseudomonadota bacterium]
MKTRIDEDECTACEECVETVPEVFAMNEDGDMAIVKVDVVPADLEDDVKEAAEDCPAEAIIVEE